MPLETGTGGATRSRRHIRLVPQGVFPFLRLDRAEEECRPNGRSLSAQRRGCPAGSRRRTGVEVKARVGSAAGGVWKGRQYEPPLTGGRTNRASRVRAVSLARQPDPRRQGRPVSV